MRDEPSYPAFSGSKAGEEDERQRLEMEALEAGDGIEVWEDERQRLEMEALEAGDGIEVWEDERQRLEMEALEAGDGIEVWEDVEVVTRRPPIVLTPEEEARAEVLRAEQERVCGRYAMVLPTTSRVGDELPPLRPRARVPCPYPESHHKPRPKPKPRPRPLGRPKRAPEPEPSPQECARKGCRHMLPAKRQPSLPPWGEAYCQACISGARQYVTRSPERGEIDRLEWLQAPAGVRLLTPSLAEALISISKDSRALTSLAARQLLKKRGLILHRRRVGSVRAGWVLTASGEWTLKEMLL